MTDTTSPNDIDIIDDTNITTTTTTTTNDDDDTFTIPPSINPTQPKNINKIYDRTTEDDPEVHPVLQKLTKHINGVEKAIKEIDDVIGQSMDFSLFSDDLQESMREVCPSDDPLDQEDFDPIAYLNEHFPDEASLNRADTLIRRGKYPGLDPSNPQILGLEASGIVVKRGKECKLDNSNIGKRVMSLLPSGGYADYVAIDERLLMPIPSTLTLRQAAAIPETWLTAYQLLHYQ